MVWRGWIVLIGFAIGGVLLGLALAGVTPTTYRAESLMVVVPSGTAGSDLAVGYARVFSRLATDPAVLTPLVAQDPSLSDLKSLSEAISVDVSPNTPMFELAADDSTAAGAAALANLVGDAVSDYTRANQVRTGYRAEVMTVALPPEEPSSPNIRLNAVIGGSVGLVVAGLLVLAVAARPEPGPEVSESRAERY